MCACRTFLDIFRHNLGVAHEIFGVLKGWSKGRLLDPLWLFQDQILAQVDLNDNKDI